MNEYNFSYSKIATFLECPKRYELQYIKKLIEFKETIYTAFGEAVHKAIEMTIDNNYDFEQALAIFEKVLKEKTALIDPREMQLIFMNEWKKKGNDILQQFFSTYYDEIKAGKIIVLDTEKYFKFEIMPNVFYSGIIDLLIKHNEEIEEIVKLPVIKTLKSGKQKVVLQKSINKKVQTKYKIIDWKTGAIKTNDNLQLLSYTIPMLILNDIFIEEIVYAFLKHKRDVKVEVNRNIIQKTKDKIISIINNMIKATENNTFNMCLDKNKCRYCNVKKACDKDFELLLNNSNK